MRVNFPQAMLRNSAIFSEDCRKRNAPSLLLPALPLHVGPDESMPREERYPHHTGCLLRPEGKVPNYESS